MDTAKVTRLPEPQRLTRVPSKHVGKLYHLCPSCKGRGGSAALRASEPKCSTCDGRGLVLR